MIYLLLNNKKIRSHRLSVRTAGFHPAKRSSILLGTAIMTFYVYLLISEKNNRFTSYVGYTNDIKKRLVLHNSGKGAKFTKGKKWKLIYKKRYNSKSIAMVEEYKLKKNINKRKEIKLNHINNIK